MKDVTQQEAGQDATVRRRVVEAAIQVCLEDGPRDAALEKVAARADVDLDTLLANYPSRYDLLTTVGGRLYTQAFPFEHGLQQRGDLGSFLRTYLQRQEQPLVRLVWHIGDVLAPVHPDRIDAAYWHLVGELELRLLDAGLAEGVAHQCSLVLAPALMLVARRAAFDLTTQAELRDFVAAACHMAENAVLTSRP